MSGDGPTDPLVTVDISFHSRDYINLSLTLGDLQVLCEMTKAAAAGSMQASWKRLNNTLQDINERSGLDKATD